MCSIAVCSIACFAFALYAFACLYAHVSQRSRTSVHALAYFSVRVSEPLTG
jgi:hypothetical protein